MLGKSTLLPASKDAETPSYLSCILYPGMSERYPCLVYLSLVSYVVTPQCVCCPPPPCLLTSWDAIWEWKRTTEFKAGNIGGCTVSLTAIQRRIGSDIPQHCLKVNNLDHQLPKQPPLFNGFYISGEAQNLINNTIHPLHTEVKRLLYTTIL